MEDNNKEAVENLVDLNQSLNRRRKKLYVIGTFTILGVLLLAVILFFAITDSLEKFLTNSKCATDIQ
jgi:hypothetical protein